MHSRTGLQTEYLGEDWFRLTDACIKGRRNSAWSHGSTTDRWPSGCAGGLVTKEPPFRRKYLTLTLNEAADSSEPPLAVFAARIDGLSLSPGYRSFDRLQPGETKLVFRVHTMQPQSVYNGFTDSDRLSLAATERFLDVTHRQYAARCTEFSSIRGVFTDEPHRGWCFPDFPTPVKNAVGRSRGRTICRRRLRRPMASRCCRVCRSCFCFCAGSRFQG